MLRALATARASRLYRFVRGTLALAHGVVTILSCLR
jgi:hypothetical protein